MFHILGIIFFIILFVLILGVTIITTIIRALFRRNKNSYYNGNPYNQQQTTHTDSENHIDGKPKRKKVFDKEEGEYVDFEEVD